jgi:hypothetical protein
LIVCLLVGVGLVSASPLSASINNETFRVERDTHVIYNTPGIPDDAAWEKFEAERIEAERKAAQAKRLAQAKVKAKHERVLQCVTYAKNYLGVYGTWGNGGRKLSLNSDGDVGDVVIFKTIHVAVVIANDNGVRTIAEANYDYRGSVRTRILLDSEVRGYHKF